MPQNEYSKNTAYPRVQFTDHLLRHYPDCETDHALIAYGERIHYNIDALKCAIQSKLNPYCDLSALSYNDQVLALMSFQLVAQINARLNGAQSTESNNRDIHLALGETIITELKPYMKVLV